MSWPRSVEEGVAGADQGEGRRDGEDDGDQGELPNKEGEGGSDWVHASSGSLRFNDKS